MTSAAVSGPLPLAMGVMKGPSSHHNRGETFTITCYTCGMPSSKEWAQRVHTRPRSIPGRPFYPFLADLKSPPAGAQFSAADGTTFLCAFCQASLEAQWISFEKRNILVKDRQYSLNNFICSVCSIETYRKRVRALPFQEFPFLTKERPRGSLTLGKSPLAVVCLDCSETLWAQSSEYDRWGLPIQKRHFNWMSRPPPPEDSMEATVARLPSGETQLPRCPPTEPLVIPRRKESFHAVAIRNSISEFGIPNSSSQSQAPNAHQQPSRRMVTELLGQAASPERSIVSSKSPSSGSGKSPSRSIPDPHGLVLHGAGVPVVTVAPMASYATTTSTNSIVNREPSKLVGMSSLPNLDALRASQKAEIHTTNNNISASLLPLNQNYGHFGHWSGANHLEQFPYPPQPPPGLESMISGSLQQGSGQFPWIPSSTITNPDYVRYQAYLSAIAGNNYKSAVESYFSQPHPHPLLQTSESLSSDVTTHSLSRTVNTNRSRTFSNPTTSHQASIGLGGKYNVATSSSNLANNPALDIPSRKRTGMSLSPPSLPKMSNLHNISSARPSSDFVTVPRLTRHLDSAKGVERNRNYIQSVSAIVNELELSRPRIGKTANDPLSEPQKRKQAVEDVNGAMDLSLMRALKSPRVEALSTSLKLCSTIPQDRKPNSAFLIANLCSENMSPPQLKERKPTKLPPYSKEQGKEVEGRDSVIVKIKSPARSLNDNSPLHVTATAVEEHIKQEEEDNFPKAPRILMTPLHVNSSSAEATTAVNQLPPDASPTTTENSPSLPVNGVQLIPFEATNEEHERRVENVNSPKHEGSMSLIPVDSAEAEEKILEESIATFKKQKAERIAEMDKINAAKERFLRLLELVPPKEKNEIDLRILLSRYNRNTLPPIKLRVAEKDEEEEVMSEIVEKHVLLTAFDDPSLKKSVTNPKLLSFMTNLDMRPASRAEKYRREENWRLKLAERIARLKRGRKLSGERKPWDMKDGISKHLLQAGGARKRCHSIPPVSERKFPKFLRSLSVSLPPEPHRCCGVQSSDLLATVVTNEEEKELMPNESQVDSTPTSTIPNRLGMSSENLKKMLRLTQRDGGRTPVITYPKYIPSYAVPVPEKGSPPSPATPVPRGKILLPPPPSDNQTKEVLNVPLITRSPAPLTTISIHNENGVLQVSSPSSAIDGIIQRSSTCWKETKEEIERLVQMKYETKTETRIPSAAELKRLRRSINAQQLEMKGMVKWLKQLSNGSE